MKNIKRFDKFTAENQKVDESWRQVNLWLKIPRLILDKILQKIIGFVPNLGMKYDKNAAKIDDGSSLGGTIIKDEPIKLTLNDIKNKRMRNTLKATGIFNEWNIYTFDRTYENRQPIYITKDELKKGDKFYGERIHESDVDSEYKNTRGRKFLKTKGVEDFSEIEPQFWVVAAKHSENHDEMADERKIRSVKKEKRKLEKDVEKAIKEGDFTGGSWSSDPIAFQVVKADRVDLMKKIIDIAFDKQELSEIINSIITPDGEVIASTKYKDSPEYRSLIDEVKSDEMRELIEPHVEDIGGF